MEPVANTLRNLRNMLELSQMDVVAKLNELGIKANQQKMSRWENGRNTPNAEQFIALCKVYNVKDTYRVFVEQDYSEPAPDLNKEGEKKLAEYKQLLLATGMYSPVMPERKIVKFPGRTAPLYSIGASAGTGQFRRAARGAERAPAWPRRSSAAAGCAPRCRRRPRCSARSPCRPDRRDIHCS